jgi:hypothetical protein
MAAKRAKKRTTEEMQAYYLEMAQRCQDKIDGKEVEDLHGDVIKSLKKRLKKTETALRSAQITVNGVPSSDGKGWQRAPQSEKILKTRERLAQQIDALARAEEFAATLPFDVDRLRLLIRAAEAGETVEMPNNLHSLKRNTETASDEEIEADFIANQENANA